MEGKYYSPDGFIITSLHKYMECDKMVEIKQVISTYRGYKKSLSENDYEVEQINKALADAGINCKIVVEGDDDGETINFVKIELQR